MQNHHVTASKRISREKGYLKRIFLNKIQGRLYHWPYLVYQHLFTLSPTHHPTQLFFFFLVGLYGFSVTSCEQFLLPRVTCGWELTLCSRAAAQWIPKAGFCKCKSQESTITWPHLQSESPCLLPAHHYSPQQQQKDACLHLPSSAPTAPPNETGMPPNPTLVLLLQDTLTFATISCAVIRWAAHIRGGQAFA